MIVDDGTLYEGKLSRTVLRGERGSNTPDLPGDQMALSHQSLSGGSSSGRALNENKSCLGF